MSEVREQGLAALMADVLTADRPDPELLVRYAQDSSSLTPEEREEIEYHLAHTPGYSAQLSILQRMLAAKSTPRLAPARAAPRRARMRWMWVPMAMAASAAAAVAIGVGLNGMRDPGGIGSQPMAQNTEVPPPPPPPREGRIQLASLSLPTYQRPAGSGDRPRLGTATRGRGSAVTLEALVPDHVGRTLSAAPDLAWFISKDLGSGSELQFTLALEQSNQPVSSVKLPIPSRSGVQRISLAELGAELALGKRYRWSVLLRGPGAGETGFASAQGFIERIEPDAALQERLAQAPDSERASLYAEAGLWYDALDAVLERRERAPDDASATKALGALLDAAALSRLKGS